MNTLADEDNWTTVVTRRSKKATKKQPITGRQTKNMESGGQSKHYSLNWRNNADITSFYFTHFPEEVNEELLWGFLKSGAAFVKFILLKGSTRKAGDMASRYWLFLCGLL